MRSATWPLRFVVVLTAVAGLLGGCGWPDAYSSMPEAVRLPKPQPRSRDPEPQIAILLQANGYSVFAESSKPTNIMIAKPRPDPESVGWIFCIKANVNNVAGSPMGVQTSVVRVEFGGIGRRRAAEPSDGCDTESYQRLR